MSQTRRSSNHNEFNQERYASGVELQGDFLRANLVAKRVSALGDSELRELVWFVQDISMRKGCRVHPSCNQFSAALPSAGNEANGYSGLEMLAVELLVRGGIPRSDETIRRAVGWLQQFALDASDRAVYSSLLFNADPLSILRAIKLDAEAAIGGLLAETSVSVKMKDALEFAKDSRGLVLIEGTYRVGKSFSSQAWCMANLGEARYVQLTSSRDEESFYRAIAKAIGVAASLTKKASEIRERVEQALQSQGLLLVMDEAAYTLPQATRTRYMPQRLTWIMTALVNRGVAVALIASRDFSRIMDHLRRTLPIWGQEPFWGRVRRRVDLPDTLHQDDLLKISTLLAPEVGRAGHLLMAGLAARSSGHAASLESIFTLAMHLARKEAMPLDFRHIEQAGAELDPTFRPEAYQGRAAARASHTPRGGFAGRSIRPISEPVSLRTS